MKIKIIAAVLIFLFTANARGQGITVSAGANIVTSGGVSIVIDNGNFINNSATSNMQSADVYFTGSTDDTIGGSFNNLIFSNIYVSKKSATLFLNNDISVSGKIIMQKGNIDLNQKNIQLASNASIKGETEKSRITGIKGGEVKITVSMSSPSSQNPGNLGLMFTSLSNLGSVSISRGHKAQSNNGNKSIERYYKVVPTNNSGLDATIRVTYFDKELKGNSEADLNIYESNNDGSSWTNKSFSARDAAANYVEQNSFASLYMYTLGASTFGFAKAQSTLIAGEQKITNNENSIVMKLLPNPVTGSVARLQVQSGFDGLAEVKITSVSGKLISHFSTTLKKGANELSFNAGSFVNGVYFISLETKDGLKKMIQFVKQ